MCKNMKVLFFLTFGIASFGQDIQNKYLITYVEKRIASKEYILKVNSYPEFLKKKVLREINEGEEKILFLTKNESFYSLKENIVNEKTVGDRTVRIAVSDYYKNFKKNQLLIEKNIGVENIVIKTTLHPLKWKLINETRKINSLLCKKAISIDVKGNEIIAWYAEDIKIENGPSRYGGLPGVILELKSKSKSFILKEIRKTNTTEEISFPSLKNAITMEDFKKRYNPNNKVKKTTRYN